MRSLYISHTGLAEPLGQTQVFPYLAGLAKRGVEIEVLSFERAGTSAADLATVAQRVESAGIRWRPLTRSVTSRALGTKIWESGLGVARSLRLALARRPDIVHARSYLPAAVADVVSTLVPKSKLLFDCRGMLGDEYADCGHWSREGINYRLLKLYERRLFRCANGMVVLTDALRRWLNTRGLLGAGVKLQVVPCCVDTERFRPDPDARARERAALGLGDRLTVTYAGSLGSYYREQDMIRFVMHLRRLRPNAVFLVLTPSNTEPLLQLAREAGLSARDVIVRAVDPSSMPAALTAGDIGLSFILSCFSKMGSSPTKVAEYLGVGLPIVANGDIGDVGDLARHRDACVVLNGFDDDALAAAARTVLPLAERSYAERAAATGHVASTHFSLAKVGIPRYAALYEALLRQ